MTISLKNIFLFLIKYILIKQINDYKFYKNIKLEPIFSEHLKNNFTGL